MDRQMDEIDWDSLSLNEWGENLQNILISTNVTSYNNVHEKAGSQEVSLD